MKTGTNKIVYDEAHDGLQQLYSFDAKLNSLKHKLSSFHTNYNSAKRKLEFAKTQTSTPHKANLVSQKQCVVGSG